MLGRSIVIDFIPRQVIGVMPRDFRFVNLSPDVFLPQRFPLSELRPDVFSYNGIARLEPGATLAFANQDTARVWKTWGDTERVGKMLAELAVTPDVRPLKEDVVGDVGTALQVLMGALGLVLLLVCANVANLVLVRAQARRQEFAIRAALGAGWGRIARVVLVESLTLGILGGALGLVLAYLGLRLLVAQGPTSLPRLAEISLDRDGPGIRAGVLAGVECAVRIGRGAQVRYPWPNARPHEARHPARGSSVRRTHSSSRK